MAMRKSDRELDKRLFFLDGDNYLALARCDTARPLKNEESCSETSGSFSSYSEPPSESAGTNITWTYMKVRLDIPQPWSRLMVILMPNSPGARY